MNPKKSLVAKTMLLLVITFFFCTAQVSLSAQSSVEIFEKVVNHYDPDGKWANFSGKVQLSWLNNGQLDHEFILLDNANNNYECVRKRDDGVFLKGVKDGQAYFMVNEKKMTEKEMPKQYKDWPYGLTEEGAYIFQEHHTFHFSIPLTLHASGAQPNEGVGKKTIFGADCLSITFDEYPKAYENGWYNGSFTLYINPEKDYALHAVFFDNGWGEDKGGIIALLDGELEINGIKIIGSQMAFEANTMKYVVLDILKPIPDTE